VSSELPEVSVFDAYRASRALEGQLADGDALQVVATDDVSRNSWCLTKQELVVLDGDVIVSRIAFDRMHGEVRPAATGTEVRVRDAKGGPVLIASFRRANTLTSRLVAILADAGPA
jgi:hypothetical protein